jgi:virulence-associated protein VagC
LAGFSPEATSTHGRAKAAPESLAIVASLMMVSVGVETRTTAIAAHAINVTHHEERIMSATAKLFMHGRSQAIRLPKEFRFEGTEVRVSKVGDTVILGADQEATHRLRQVLGRARRAWRQGLPA